MASAVTAAARQSEETASPIGLGKTGHLMPIYEFKCPTCGKVEERMQSGYEPVVPRCECGPWMILQLTPSAVVYKGKGWAKRDRDTVKRQGA